MQDDQIEYAMAEGAMVADVAFEAGSYSLERLADLVNQKSQTTHARVSGGMLLLRNKANAERVGILFKNRSIGCSMTSIDAARALDELAKVPEPQAPYEPVRNRHERRKAKALARRR